MTTFAFTRSTPPKKANRLGTSTFIGTVDLANLTGPFAVNDIFGSFVLDEFAVITSVQLETNGFAGASVFSVGDATDNSRFILGHTTGAGYVKSTINQQAQSGQVVTKGVGYKYPTGGQIDLKLTAVVPTTGIITLRVEVCYDLAILS